MPVPIQRIFLVLFMLLASACTFANIDFNDYDEDVAALLREYQAQSDKQGSYNPSVLMFNESFDQNTLVDFENGLIVVTAKTEKMLQQSIMDVLLTQIDPSVIDAKTAQDFGLINKRTNRPFFWGQVLDHYRKPIGDEKSAVAFAKFLLQRKTSKLGRYTISIDMVATHKDIAGGKYVKYVKSAGQQYNVPISLVMAIMETESSFNPFARSQSNALGLMQIKADTAGRDYFEIIKGYQHTPS
jgi:membrane-bound lytic murein transglycosylase C